jgi:hypothetical protein
MWAQNFKIVYIWYRTKQEFEGVIDSSPIRSQAVPKLTWLFTFGSK